MTKPEDLIPTALVCATIGIHYSTLSRWVRDGRVTPAVRMPGRTGAFLWDPDEVDRIRELYAQSRARTPAVTERESA